ncbi:hypothetical protein [uncultured Treponema sp.]|uniref:hypothetical protein n=1 Tax=uncultured Treponema sp. TaxID=162155 RepID=UPI0025CF1194|nr:hypothetical protein [uncultured Treponema sp.]
MKTSDNSLFSAVEKFLNFDLGEMGGGKQLIIDYRTISSYVSLEGITEIAKLFTWYVPQKERA